MDINKIYQNFSQLYITEKISFNGKDTVVTYLNWLDYIIDIIINGQGLRRPWVWLGIRTGSEWAPDCHISHGPGQYLGKQGEPSIASLLVPQTVSQSPQSPSNSSWLRNSNRTNSSPSLSSAWTSRWSQSLLGCLTVTQSLAACTMYCVSCWDRVSSSRRKYKYWSSEGAELRSHESNLVSFTMFQLEAGGNKKKLIKYSNIKNNPVAVLPPGDLAKPYLLSVSQSVKCLFIS